MEVFLNPVTCFTPYKVIQCITYLVINQSGVRNTFVTYIILGSPRLLTTQIFPYRVTEKTETKSSTLSLRFTLFMVTTSLKYRMTSGFISFWDHFSSLGLIFVYSFVIEYSSEIR